MASGWYKKGITLMANGGVDLDTSDLRAMLVRTTYTFDVDHDFVNDVVATECDGATYARIDLATLGVAGIAGGAKFTTENLVWATLGAGATANKGVIFYLHDGGGDAACALLLYSEFTVATNGNGGSFTATCPAGGWGTVVNV